MTSRIFYEDRWGEILDRPEAGVVEVRWYDTTRDLDSGTFNEWLKHVAAAVESSGRHRILVDSSSFLMGREHMDAEWRDANITVRYNTAGLRKFAFLMPEGMPLIGADPEKEGPADYPTGYFGRRLDALEWLTGE